MLIQSVTVEFERPPQWLINVGGLMPGRRRARKKLKRTPDVIIDAMTPEMRRWQEKQLSAQIITLEADLQDRCEEVLRLRGHWFLHLSDPSTRYNNPGVPDLIICVNGLFLAVELKTATGRLRNDQHIQIERIRNSGGRAFVVRSVERFIEILNEMEDSKHEHIRSSEV